MFPAFVPAVMKTMNGLRRTRKVLRECITVYKIFPKIEKTYNRVAG